MQNVNQLFICLPHYKEELGKELYNSKIERLEQSLLTFHTTVSEMAIVSQGLGEYSMEESILSAAGRSRKRRSVILTDDGDFALFCAESELPYCILLDEGSKKASLPNGAFCIESIEDIEYEYLERIYRRTVGLPWDILETERLKIREITPEDVPRLYELYADPSVTRYMEPLYPEESQELAYTRDYIWNVYGFYGYGMWLITLKSTGEIIGRAGLEYKEGFDGLELGFMLGVEYQHQGYAYEACRAILDYGRAELGQTSFRAVVHKDNNASRVLCERLGLQAGEEVRLSQDEDGYMEYLSITAYTA